METREITKYEKKYTEIGEEKLYYGNLSVEMIVNSFQFK